MHAWMKSRILLLDGRVRSFCCGKPRGQLQTAGQFPTCPFPGRLETCPTTFRHLRRHRPTYTLAAPRCSWGPPWYVIPVGAMQDEMAAKFALPILTFVAARMLPEPVPGRGHDGRRSRCSGPTSPARAESSRRRRTGPPDRRAAAGRIPRGIGRPVTRRAASITSLTE